MIVLSREETVDNIKEELKALFDTYGDSEAIRILSESIYERKFLSDDRADTWLKERIAFHSEEDTSEATFADYE